MISRVRFLSAAAITCLSLATVAVCIGAPTNYHYDTNNRLESIEYEGGTFVVFSYDENGNRCARTVGQGVYSIDVSWGENGTVSPPSTKVASGGSLTFSIKPDLHYHVAAVLADGTSVGAVTSYTFSNVTTNRSLYAEFAIDTYTITASVAGNVGGTISPGSAAVSYGGSQTFTMTPNTGYHVAGVLVDGVSKGPVTSYTFSDVSANHTIQVSFAINTYTITASVVDGYGGSISPASATVTHGGSQTFTITPIATFSIADVRVDGVSRGAVSTYTFSNVITTHIIQVAFNYSTNPVKNQRTGQLYSSIQTAYSDAANGDVLLCRNSD